MDEQLVSPIVKILLRKLRSLHEQNVPLGREGVDTIELKRLETILSSIRDLLSDAEKQQLHNNDVRGWLKDLKEACYAAELALEELEIEADLHGQLKRDQYGSIARKVCDFISCSKLPSLRFTEINSNEIKEIRERLDAIKVDASEFGLINGNVPREKEIITTHSSSIVASEVFAERDNDKEDIIKMLIEDKEDITKALMHRNICISGPSGIGKTTLAKWVYNDKRIDKKFDIKLWTCFPRKFDEKKIIIDMIYSVTGRVENNMEIDQLQQVLQAILEGKKYLIVLDEVVDEFYWNSITNWTKFKSLLSVGAKDSKIIIITTWGIGPNSNMNWETYRLKRLSNESSLSLFMRYAFKEGKEKNGHLVKIGEEIITKDRFLPLVVKILGSILHFSTDEDDWRYVRDNMKWLRVGGQTVSILKLGYDLLPSHLKQCFVSCSTFPKDHGFNNVTLIQFWMAHGLLQSDDENEEPESIGMRYINELRRRCLFQDFEQNFDFISFKMHHLVHDLATGIAKNECFIMDSCSGREYRHLSVVNASVVRENISGSKMTRSILFFEMIRPSQSLLESCISQFPNLRVLDFRYSDMEALPESIGKLKYLRYLNLTKSIKIKRLPKSIFKLRRLETLLLGGCTMIEELPRDIRHLVNLRMLVFSSKQRRLPKNGIGCLTSLRYLGIGSCHNLKCLFEDIGRLQALRTLIIGDCPTLVYLPSGVKDLSSLENLMFSNRKENAKCNLKMDKELQSTKPCLHMLCINGLPEFNEFPQWLLQCSANTLQWLAIKNCPNFKGLPAESLQILKSLEVLEILNCPKFSSLPEDMHGLTAMRKLKVRDCPDLSKRCKQDTGEDWLKIDHIPKIELDGKVIKSSDYN